MINEESGKYEVVELPVCLGIVLSFRSFDGFNYVTDIYFFLSKKPFQVCQQSKLNLKLLVILDRSQACSAHRVSGYWNIVRIFKVRR